MFTRYDSKHFIVKFSLNYWYTSLCYLKGNSLVIIISMARSRRSELPRQTKTSFDWRPRSAFPGLELGKSKIWVVTTLGLTFEKIVMVRRKKINSCLVYGLHTHTLHLLIFTMVRSIPSLFYIIVTFLTPQ